MPIDTDGTVTAAQRYGWGTPARVDDFTAGLGQWSIYDGPGHAGNGVRSPSAVTARDGVLTISGDSRGTTGGMRWDFGSRYGRWEGRMRAPVSDPTYNALMLLWPDAEDFPVGGEIDFVEMLDHTRREVNVFVHYGPDNRQVSGAVRIDATQWHNWAVEWTPAGITTFVDGQPWWSTTNTAILPPRSMHLCLQLDWFPGKGAAVTPSQMFVDWVAFYPLAGSTPVSPGPTSPTPSAPPTSAPPTAVSPTTSPSSPVTTPPAVPTTVPPTTVPPTTAPRTTAPPTSPPPTGPRPTSAPVATTSSRPVPSTTPAPSPTATPTGAPATSSSGSAAPTTSGS